MRYLDPIFQEVQRSEGIVYGANINLLGHVQILRLDCYQPLGDTLSQRPLLIWIHGGAFVSGNRGDRKAQAMGTGFAKRGYVVASIDYRVGVSDTTSPTAFLESMLRAVQDGKAAVRFFRKHASIYGIDTTHIYVGGSSAGGCTALLMAYWNQDEIPLTVDQARWGDLEGNSGHLGYSSAVQGVLNCWGGIADTNWIDAGEPPVTAFHGMGDRIVPYDVGYIQQGFLFNGSAAVCRAAQRQGIYNELVLIPEMAHGVTNEAQMDSLIRFSARFFYRLLTNQIPSIAARSVQEKEALELDLYPNPFNHRCCIRFAQPAPGWAQVIVYDIIGRQSEVLFEGFCPAGKQCIKWQPYSLASGLYVIALLTPSNRCLRYGLLIK